jgi:hypothetical protein
MTEFIEKTTRLMPRPSAEIGRKRVSQKPADLYDAADDNRIRRPERHAAVRLGPIGHNL